MTRLIDLDLGPEHDVKYLFVHLHVKTPEIALLPVFAYATMVGQAVIVKLVSFRERSQLLKDLFICSKNYSVDI